MTSIKQAAHDIGMVVPRSVAALRTARSWNPFGKTGFRQLAEVALDELALAAMTLMGPMGELTRPSDDYERVAEELGTLGIAGAHAEPAPLQSGEPVHRRIGTLSYEEMTFQHDPNLPVTLEREGLGGPSTAVVHLLRHDQGPRPWLVWVHGTGQGGPTDLFSSRAYHYHRTLGYNLALPIQPGQGVRRRAWPAYPDVDPIVNVAGMMRTISEVRALVRWLRPNATSLTVAGLSLGSAVAALVASLEPDVDAVALYVPILGLNQMIAQHQDRWGVSGEELARVMSTAAVTALTSVVDPLGVTPAAPPERRLIVGAWHDRMALRRPAEELHRKWNGQVHWHDGSHVGLLFSNEVRRVTEQFLLEQRST